MSASQDFIVRALREYSTFNFPTGGFLPGLTLWSPERQQGITKIVGPAHTVKYALLDDPAPKHPSHYIDSIPEGAVVFISSPKTPNAVYGGLMSTRAQASKAAGSVIDGGVRDLQEHRTLNYPVFARDIGTAPPYGAVKIVGVNVPIQLQSEEPHLTVLPLMEKQREADAKLALAIREDMAFTEASRIFRA
ncbi:ribonuclease E inhibitor RraA/Dimethylmenaquinone methyltransferase [Aspergillus terricola var. indicus]